MLVALKGFTHMLCFSTCRLFSPAHSVRSGFHVLAEACIDKAVFDTLDATSSLDAAERMKSVGRATSGVVVDFFSSASDIISQPTILDISAATTELSTQMFARLNQLRK
jgi:hypothetical protein